MIGERIALLVGLFLAPGGLLWLGHEFREKSMRKKRAFWGGVIGHTLGLIITLIATLAPPVWWAGGPFWRDFAIHWSLLFGVLIGAAVGVVLERMRDSRKLAEELET